MGNALNFIKGHGKRLINRYNAQYRALKFLDREKLAKAPRHKVPLEYQNINSSSLHDFGKKDSELDNYLKNVYVRSEVTIPENSSSSNIKNPLRPLEESKEPRNYFIEPDDIAKGFCTLSQVSKFLASHEDDPENNSPATIAKNYNLDKETVENIIHYHCIFKSLQYSLNTASVPDHDKGKTLKQLYDEFKSGKEETRPYHKLPNEKAKQIKVNNAEIEKNESKDDELNKKAIKSK